MLQDLAPHFTSRALKKSHLESFPLSIFHFLVTLRKHAAAALYLPANVITFATCLLLLTPPPRLRANEDERTSREELSRSATHFKPAAIS